MSTLPPLVVPGDVSSLTAIAEYVVEAGKAAGLSRNAVYRLRLAVDEIATNIVVHGYQAHGEAGSLIISADIDPKALTICIEDSARPYDPRGALEGGLEPAPLDERGEGGLGLYLAARSVDTLDYERVAGRNRNWLEMRLPADTEGRESGPHARLLIAAGPAERSLLASALAATSYDITWADDGRQIRRLLRHGHFDVLLLGLDVPGQTGEACLRELRAYGQAMGDGAIPPVALLYDLASQARLETYLEAFSTAGAENEWPGDGTVADILALESSPGLIRARVSRLVGRARLEAAASSLHKRNAELESLAHDFTEVILPLGVALTKERQRDRLLERIVVEAMTVCRADGGTLYLRDPDDALRFAIMRTKSKGLVYGGSTGLQAPFPPLRIRDPETGEPNYLNVATSAVIEHRSINIPDIYDPKAVYDFSGAKAFDEKIAYRTVSCLTVPLTGNGELIGALQLLNAQHPETGAIVPFNLYQQRVCESLASQAAIALYNQELLREREQLSRLAGEMQIGREIQTSFLPHRLPEIPGWELAARVRPARLVSGDFYDAFDLGAGSVGLVIADVCDKGVGAAIFMALIRSLLRAFAQIDWIAEHAARQYVSRDPAERRVVAPGALEQAQDGFDDATLFKLEVALRRSVCLTNDYIAQTHLELDMFATFFFGILVPERGVLLYINSGHPPLLVMDQRGIRQMLVATGPATGIIAGANFEVAQLTLEPGQLVLGYTDGVIDARDSAGEPFGQDRFLALVTDEHDGAEAVVARIAEALEAHTGATDLFDDYALLAVHRKG